MFTTIRHAVPGLLLLTSLSFAEVTPTSAMTPAEDLLLRTLGTPGAPPATVTVGVLPRDLTVPLPLPTSLRVAGSVTRTEPDGHPITWVYLSARDSAPDTLRALRAALDRAGWHDVKVAGAPRWGFQSSSLPLDATFHFQERGARLFVRLDPRPHGTDLTFELTFPEVLPVPNAAPARDPGVVLPALVPPEGVTVDATIGPVTPSSSSTTATLKSGLSLDVIERHYAAQLTSHGWQQLHRRTSGGVVASWWVRRADRDEQHAVLSVAAGAGLGVTELNLTTSAVRPFERR
ncbi:hypothetical protein [Deinococcus pimensis]|uniref:hypothetical protein n=1 Tax=Deinococcus pimensis TaxID=309888 RepID=UPI0004846677|nr:hypothetical protein [Deinococcus pimensis]